jgi:hypothetical protein
MTANVTFTSASVFLTGGTDLMRVGIYRGSFTTGVLVGQTANTYASIPYFTKPIIAITTPTVQNLTFVIGEQIVVAFSQNGGGTTPKLTTGISDATLATISSNTYETCNFKNVRFPNIGGQIDRKTK